MQYDAMTAALSPHYEKLGLAQPGRRGRASQRKSPSRILAALGKN